ncbi:MAG: ribokinase [Bacteroidota bacterium]
MKQQNILVIGSSNTDMVIRSSHLPAPGETILGGSFMMNAGGKGANQAVAAAKLNGAVTFIARLGADVFGQQAMVDWQELGIQTDYIVTDSDNPSGIALILVDQKGENCISVALGANAALVPHDINQAVNAVDAADYLLMQLEVPLETVVHAAHLAKQGGAKIVLNPAPAQALPDELLRELSIITPNQTEAELLTGIAVNDLDSAAHAAAYLRQKGVQTVIITMGAQGAYVQSENLEELIPAPKVQTVDTTAAGDTFNGALVVALAEGRPLQEAIRFANAAAAYAVTQPGAQASTPLRHQIITG